VAALSLAGTAMAAGNDTQSSTTERLPTARQGQPLDQSTAQQQGQSNAGNASGSQMGNSSASQSGSSNAGSQGSMASEEHNPQAVRSVQQALKQKGYDVGSVDGQMGPNTENALRQFQRAQGISQTGNLDQQTLSALGVEQGGSSQNGMSSSQGSSASSGNASGNTSGTGSQGAMSSGSSSMGSSQGAHGSQGSSSAGQSSQSNSSSIHSSAYK
jgi:peptidoglycan hydrolase-like protein with peptidoglycan-binding domain